MNSQMQTTATRRSGLLERAWIYQKERFPLAGHGPLIAAFSFCAVSYSRVLRGGEGLPGLNSLVVAFGCCLLFFLQLRVADEFKDVEDDARWRPYRPVPRGLVSLRELAVLFALGAAVQLGLSLWLDPRLTLVLLGVWIYLAGMCREFFIGDWLKPRPLLYMVSHMAIMPMVDFFATATDWLPVHGTPPAGLGWFLAASFFNGMVIEIGRKIRSQPDEEEGVVTYSAAWGRARAVAGWWLVLTLTLACAVMAAFRVEAAAVVACVLGVMLLLCVAAGLWLLRRPGAVARGQWIERMSGLWTLALYLSLGAGALIWGSGS
ncbi:MAG: UbiA family prenyltransferase [Phycisphaeraceae bacterium]